MNEECSNQVVEEARFPLSFAQTRIWLLDQFMDGKSVAYNMPMVVRLEGVLDEQALHRALNFMVERHEPLRTTFLVENGAPVQVIAPSANLHLPLVDLSFLAGDIREAESRRLI
jgi:hypothetical protein